MTSTRVQSPSTAAARVPAPWPAVAGIVAAVAGLVVGALVARILSATSPLVAIGNRVVDLSPQPVKEWAIATFGTADKTVLLVGSVVVVLGFAALIGVLAARRFPWGGLAVIALSLVAFAAAAVEGSVAAVVAVLAQTAVGLWTLRWLLRPADPGGAAGEMIITHHPAGFDRRSFLRRSGLLVAGTAVAGLLISVLPEPVAERARQVLRLPAPTDPAAPMPAGLDVPGITPQVIDNDSFYRIDTALVVPDVDPGDWRLSITGLVDTPLSFSFDDLLARGLVERRITLTCVSNEVGGDLVGNATWLGVPIRELLAAAGVQPGADAVKSTSTDGWTAGTPLEAMTDDRDALLAVGMNGQPLPLEHGFPARLVVPGLYGYVSATKWVTELEVTRFADFSAYWTDRGWSERGPIKTQSRIDVPADSQIPAGRTWIAGVAWAQHTGIDVVEVRIDDGPWQVAELAVEDTIDTWRQWRLAWQAEPGEHTVTVRATDRSGYTQIEEVVGVVPDGATGYPRRNFRVV